MLRPALLPLGCAASVESLHLCFPSHLHGVLGAKARSQIKPPAWVAVPRVMGFPSSLPLCNANPGRLVPPAAVRCPARGAAGSAYGDFPGICSFLRRDGKVFLFLPHIDGEDDGIKFTSQGHARGAWQNQEQISDLPSRRTRSSHLSPPK